MALQQDPDDALLVRFFHHANPNEAKSLAAGRPIFDDMEAIEIRSPGNRNTISVHPATEECGWRVDPETGGQVKITYAERFSRQYRQFKSQMAQTKAGTPLEYARFLTEGRRAELRALNIFTIEALATLDGQELKNLGPGGREMKNAAMEFIEQSKNNVPTLQLQAEIEALRARNMALEEDLLGRKNKELEFEGMSIEALRDFITEHTGHMPRGNLDRKQLVRMAVEAQGQKAA
jgi:hypothetical protein